MSIILLIIFIFIIILLSYILIGLYNFNYRLPKKFSHNLISSKKISMHSTSELPSKIDTIVIGSGISGLSAASALARSGQTVVLIEQHNIPGGWFFLFFDIICRTHTYQVKGYTFDTGVHWIAAGSSSIFNLIGAKPFEWTRLDNESNNMVYYTRVIDGKKYEFQPNLDNVVKMLIENFPHEKKGIEEYFSKKNIDLALGSQRTYFLYNFTYNIPLINIITKKFYLKYEAFRKITVQQKFDELFTDETLKLLLLQSLSTQGLTAEQCSYSFHLFLFDHFKDGIVYPAEGYTISKNQLLIKGSEEFAKNTLNVILRYNKSRILLQKKVEKILYNEKENKIYGVELNNGQQIFAKNIIATNSYLMTMEKFLNIKNEKILKDLTELKKIVKTTSSLIFTFIGIKGNVKELNLPTGMYSFQNTDSQMIAESIEQILNGKVRVFLNFSSVKMKHQPENKCSCELFLNCQYDIFDKWKNEPIKNRSQDYNEIKKQIADYLTENYLLKQFPQLRDKIDFTEVGTPLTCEYYLNYPTGSSYGFLNNEDKKQIINFKHISYESSIKGLFFAGQDISGGGLFPACLGGVYAASKVLGYMNLMDILTFRYFFKDLQNVIVQDRQDLDEEKKEENKKKEE